MKAIVLATVSAIALAACAAKEPQPVTVSKINVSADLGAVTSREAARYWRNVDADVEAALAAGMPRLLRLRRAGGAQADDHQRRRLRQSASAAASNITYHWLSIPSPIPPKYNQRLQIG